MDMICHNCGETWELETIIHEEGGLEAAEIAEQEKPEPNIIKFGDGWEIENVVGAFEIPEGHFLLNRCPSCPKKDK